ncbi:MAG: hypothetical protein WA754_09035, partial [Pseudolabrys sp.]
MAVAGVLGTGVAEADEKQHGVNGAHLELPNTQTLTVRPERGLTSARASLPRRRQVPHQRRERLQV